MKKIENCKAVEIDDKNSGVAAKFNQLFGHFE